MTIDPARWLAGAIGISELGNQTTEVFRLAGADGVLAAMMLDIKATFNGVVNRFVASPVQAEGNHGQPVLPQHLHHPVRRPGLHGRRESSLTCTTRTYGT